MNVIDKWLNSEGAKKDALKFKHSCDSLDALRHCTIFMGGRNCGKTALAKQLARQLLNSNYGLASADNWAQRHLYVTNKVYDTLGIKDYLNKVYGDPTLKFKNGSYIGYDINLTNGDILKELLKTPDIVDLVNQIEREEEKNKMVETYIFQIKDLKGNRYKITLEKDLKNDEHPYHAMAYGLKDDTVNQSPDFTFGYRYWEQLETQLIYDLADHGIIISRDYRDEITRELHRAKNVFRGYGSSYANFDSPYQGGYTADKKKDEVRFTAPHYAMPKIEKVIFNPPATIVQWKDGTKTVVKCQEGDEFDWEKGLAMAYVKRAFNNERTYYGLFKKNEPWMNLPNSNMRYNPKIAKEVRIIVPKNLPVTSDIIMKAHELIMKECNKKAENGIELDN